MHVKIQQNKEGVPPDQFLILMDKLLGGDGHCVTQNIQEESSLHLLSGMTQPYLPVKRCSAPGPCLHSAMAASTPRRSSQERPVTSSSSPENSLLSCLWPWELQIPITVTGAKSKEARQRAVT